MQLLITPSEAARLFGKSLFNDSWKPAMYLADQVTMTPGWNYHDDTALLGCIFWAGRIQGIREERLRNKARIAKKKPIERTFRTTNGRTIHVYKSDGFAGTCRGWNLYVECSNAAHDAMEPYRKAKAAWEAEQQNRR